MRSSSNFKSAGHLVALLSLFLCGCSAMFVPATPDPYKKLSQAKDLLEYNRPLPAERITLDALKEFQSNNDQWGIGQAYGMLGLVYKSQAVRNHEKYYRENGFLEKSVNYDNRLKKSLEYLATAEEIFVELEKFDTLVRVRLQIADLNKTLGNTSGACAAYQSALASHKQFQKKYPDVKINAPDGFTSFEQYIDSNTKELKCIE